MFFSVINILFIGDRHWRCSVDLYFSMATARLHHIVCHPILFTLSYPLLLNTVPLGLFCRSTYPIQNLNNLLEN